VKLDDVRISLSAARISAGLTQREAAKIGKVNRHTLGKWERGESKPDYFQLCGMAYIYKIPVECIIMPEKITER